MENEIRKPGRPSFAEQQETTRLIRPLYLKTLSMECVARLLNKNRHTIKKRYDRWKREDTARLHSDLDRGDSEHLAEYGNLNQSLLDELSNQFENIKSDIENARKNGDMSLSSLLATQIHLARAIDALGVKRLAVKIRPGSERVAEAVFAERIQKYVKPGT